MIGNVVYIIVQYLIREGDRTISSVHATFDGAYERIHRLAEMERNNGYEVSFTKDGGIEVRTGGKVCYEFKVHTRTIQE